ncbi:MAG: RES family NAD+ phosphorylase [Steroidobacteraceae bacterium]
MSKFPEPPGVDVLRRIPAETIKLPAGTLLARIYFAAGPHPSRWNQFRRFGPTEARWDHHLPDAGGRPTEQDRAVIYCAPDVNTCAAEVFQSTRRIDRVRNAPILVVFALSEPVTLLDVRGRFATTIGASTAIHSGPRARTRAWARQLFEAYPGLQGVHYGSSMNGHAPAVVLNERAQHILSERPEFHRALNDDLLAEVLQRIALRLSYGLR